MHKSFDMHKKHDQIARMVSLSVLKGPDNYGVLSEYLVCIIGSNIIVYE